jgi:hypothetical protein
MIDALGWGGVKTNLPSAGLALSILPVCWGLFAVDVDEDTGTPVSARALWGCGNPGLWPSCPRAVLELVPQS